MSFKLAIFDGNHARRNSVYRVMQRGRFHVEPFETLDEAFSYRGRIDTYLVGDDGEWFEAIRDGVIKALAFRSAYVSYAEGPDLKQVADAMLMGAVGYLSWPFTIEAFEEVIANPLLANRSDEASETSVSNSLSVKEQAVAEKLVQGMSSSEVAIAMGISRRTVEKHSQNMRRKLIASFDDAHHCAVSSSLRTRR